MRASDELLHSVTVCVTDMGAQAALLPSEGARAAFLAERYGELVQEACRSGMDEPTALILARSCVEGAERIMRELLALGTPVEGGRA
jgi:hypothetical protein